MSFLSISKSFIYKIITKKINGEMLYYILYFFIYFLLFFIIILLFNQFLF